jgi:TPR repeat protein
VSENGAVLNRNNRALRIHREWVTEYYTALWPEPIPFAYGMKPSAMTTDSPAYVRAAVTDTMRVNALQYLGECYFEGYGLPFDAAAAVTCYRAVLAAAPKDTPQPPAAVIEATYSLGWCLLYGVGTAVNQPEAIRLLTRASRTHGGACYTLGVCHEEGRGVVVADDREAVKYYRKAQKLGHPEAAAKVEILEKRLQSKAEAM